MDIKVGQVWKNKVGDTFEIIGVSKESFAWKMDDGEIGCTPLKFWSAIQEPILVSENPVTSVPDDWREAVQEFVDRCEKGEIKSRYTYEKFKALLDCAPSHSQQSAAPQIIEVAASLGAMCAWFEALAKKAGWTDDNAGSAYAGYEKAKALYLRILNCSDRCPSHESKNQNKKNRR